jgi:beta-fructofuranosidase
VLAQSVHGARKVTEWRDPFPVVYQDRRFLVCGGELGDGSVGGTGAVQLYEALTPELTRWAHRGAIFELHERQIANIECPNLFPLDGRWVLIISPNRPCEYYVGDIDWQRLRFIPDTHDVLDPGTTYASNIAHDESGRCLLWLWGRTETDPQRGWNGVMALPRRLTLDSAGYLRQTPATEFEALRGEPYTHPPAAIENTAIALPERVHGDCLNIAANFDLGTATSVGVRVRRGAGTRQGLSLTYHKGTGELALGAARSLLGARSKLHLRLWLDKGVAEAHTGDGTVAIFVPVHAGRDELAIELFASGGTGQLEVLKIWPMRPARFSLDGFHA